MNIITVSSKKPPSCEIRPTGVVEHGDNKRTKRGNSLSIHINHEIAPWQGMDVEAGIKILCNFCIPYLS